MWIKICANTNLQDALLAAELGADAVGFVFAPSTRQVTPAQVAAITPHLAGNIDRFGVFPGWTADQILAAVDQAGLTAVQLHAAFNPELVRSLRRGLPATAKIIQAIHWPVGGDATNAATVTRQLLQIKESGAIDHILIDAKVGEATGGTGVAFNWNDASKLFAQHAGLILAGGLHPRNVRDAIERLHPWGVDVASGVEETAGKKSEQKLADFISEARRPAD